MVLVEWRDDFALGIPEVDHEHREIVGLVNELSTTLDAEPSSMALRVLGDLYAYIAAHFALEERMMRERGYDEYHDHKADHGLLLDELRDLMDDFEAGRWTDREAFGRRVADWFSVHFRTHDARLHRMLK